MLAAFKQKRIAHASRGLSGCLAPTHAAGIAGDQRSLGRIKL
jgi:hypothetical protein